MIIHSSDGNSISIKHTAILLQSKGVCINIYTALYLNNDIPCFLLPLRKQSIQMPTISALYSNAACVVSSAWSDYDTISTQTASDRRSEDLLRAAVATAFDTDFVDNTPSAQMQDLSPTVQSPSESKASQLILPPSTTYSKPMLLEDFPADPRPRRAFIRDFLSRIEWLEADKKGPLASSNGHLLRELIELILYYTGLMCIATRMRKL